MHLKNIKVRTLETSKGWIVQVLKERNFFFFTYRKWVPLMTYSGSDRAYPYSTQQSAIDNAKNAFQNDLIMYGTGGREF